MWNEIKKIKNEKTERNEGKIGNREK
jgi:hypothetical protein